MNILITDYHCASNRGDAAILEGELAALRSVYPDAEITVMTEYPVAAQILHDVEVVPQLLAPFQLTAVKRNLATGYALAEAPFRTRGISTPPGDFVSDQLGLDAYHDADLVISTGGHYLTDIYMPDKLGVLAELQLCVQLNTPVVLYGQTVGPFGDTWWTSLIRAVLNRADLITTRDKQSACYLDDIGVSNPPVEVCSDAAFSMPIDNPHPNDHHLFANDVPIENDSGHTDRGPKISISVREWSHYNYGSQDQYFNAIAAVADWLIDTHNGQISFVSTCTSLASYHTDDRLAASAVLDRMDHDTTSSAVRLVTEEYTPYQLVDYYGSMDLHIGTRMHSNILAILGGTAVVPIEYQFKTTGLMEQFGMADQVLAIEDVTKQSLYEQVSEALTNRDAIEETLHTSLPEIKRQSVRNAQLVHEHVSL